MPPNSKMPPEILDDATNHKTIVKDRQPNQQPIENIV
jgi:hypothetical protein